MAPSITSSRFIAWLNARRTSKLSKGDFLLLKARMTSPSVLPIVTVKRGSASNCSSNSGAGKPGKASNSSAIIAAVAAAASEMNLNSTFSRDTDCASCQFEFFTSTSLSPRFQSSKMNGPVPTGFSLFEALLSEATIEASPFAMLKRKNASFFLSLITTE